MRESLLVILLLLAPHGLAEKALVVGSFVDPANAAAEASRLSRASSMSFQVVLGENAGRTLYRVIAPLNGNPSRMQSSASSHWVFRVVGPPTWPWHSACQRVKNRLQISQFCLPQRLGLR